MTPTRTAAEAAATHDQLRHPRRCLGWCVFPAGAEWREVYRRYDGVWTAYGKEQQVTHWMPFPEAPTP